MAIAVKVDPIDRDIKAFIDDTLSTAAQISELVDFALESKLAAQLIDEQILEHAVTVKSWIDGVLDAGEQAIKLHSVIVYEFGLVTDVLQFIYDELQKHSPIGSGRDLHPGLYQSSHILFADGIEIPVTDRIPEAREYVFVNTLPYSTKIESGQSSQAPQGVYELVAFQAQARFGNVAKISFIDYLGVFSGTTESYALRGHSTKLQHNKSTNRHPAIRVAV
jgi:hypothetical protein